MALARSGRIVFKVHEKSGRKAPRSLFLIDMMLKWSKTSSVARNQGSHVDLGDIIRIAYGSDSRPARLYTDVHPWFCFSLYTCQRSFDFICEDDATVTCFMVSVSHLCRRIPGAVGPRAFQSWKGWCKVKACCARDMDTVLEARMKMSGRELHVPERDDTPVLFRSKTMTLPAIAPKAPRPLRHTTPGTLGVEGQKEPAELGIAKIAPDRDDAAGDTESLSGQSMGTLSQEHEGLLDQPVEQPMKKRFGFLPF